MKRIAVVLLAMSWNFVNAQNIAIDKNKALLNEMEISRLSRVRLGIKEQRLFVYDVSNGVVNLDEKWQLGLEKYNDDGYVTYNRSVRTGYAVENTYVYNDNLLVSARVRSQQGEINFTYTYDNYKNPIVENICQLDDCIKNLFVYDKKQRLIKEIQNESVIDYYYDDNNNLSETRTSNAINRCFIYDEKGRLIEAEPGLILRDENGKDTKVISFKSSIDDRVSYKYNNLGLKSEYIQDKTNISYEYDKYGNLIKEVGKYNDTIRYYCTYTNNRSLKYELLSIVQDKINTWQQKGKYEKTLEFQQRVTAEKRDKQAQLFAQEAINQIGKEDHFPLVPSDVIYDADNEYFKISFLELKPIFIKVPRAEAEVFENNKDKLLFDGQFTLINDSIGFLNCTVENPVTGKKYAYDSKQELAFNQLQYSLTFDPLSLEVLNTQAAGSQVKESSQSVSIGKSDVDTNIPVNPSTNENTFAVIIANEKYQKEVAVEYAINDGRTFRDYCLKTLGIPEVNIHFVPNATFGNMKSELKWIGDVAKAYKGEARIIFYYAGHGMPNEQTRSAYLLPVDGFSSDFETAIKLDDIYTRLSENPAKSVTVLMDACFSGSQRDNGMLAEARGVRIRPKESALMGSIVSISAASGDETAYPYKEKQHGLFTYYLLKKLQETKGDVTYKELFDYIALNVNKQSIVVNNKSQTPQVNFGSLVQSTWEQQQLK